MHLHVQKRMSGLQGHVLSLYKQYLRLAKTKKNPELTNYIREKFREDSKIPKTLVDKIEWKLRNGKYQLDTLSSPNSDGFSIKSI
jgi:hypothetical protein